MPCPVFRPVRVVDESSYRSGRLPLIEEYEGVCTAREAPHVPDRETSFRCCNQGYSRGTCGRLPDAEELSCLRYSVTRRTAETLEVICVEEAEHEPRRWHRFDYLLERSQIRGEVLTDCMRAQAEAFCKSYLRLLPV